MSLQRLATIGLRHGRRFWSDEGGANAVEFALLLMPFITLILFVIQIGLYDMAKMSLDTGVIKESEDLQADFSTNTTPVTPSGSTLKSTVANYSGSIANTSALAVEVQPLQNLSSGAVAITDGLANYGSPRTVLAIRASFVAPSFVPGMTNALTVYSSALVRRQSQ